MTKQTVRTKKQGMMSADSMVGGVCSSHLIHRVGTLEKEYEIVRKPEKQSERQSKGLRSRLSSVVVFLLAARGRNGSPITGVFVLN